MAFCSPERSWRVAACVLLATGALWQFAVRDGSAAGIVLGCILAAGLLVAGWRVSRSRLVADTRGMTDYRLIRIVRVSWDDVAGFEVARPGGPWGGFCVRVTRRAGGTVDLLSTRGYALVPSAASYDEIHRMMWTLEDLQPGPR